MRLTLIRSDIIIIIIVHRLLVGLLTIFSFVCRLDLVLLNKRSVSWHTLHHSLWRVPDWDVLVCVTGRSEWSIIVIWLKLLLHIICTWVVYWLLGLVLWLLHASVLLLIIFRVVIELRRLLSHFHAIIVLVWHIGFHIIRCILICFHSPVLILLIIWVYVQLSKYVAVVYFHNFAHYSADLEPLRLVDHSSLYFDLRICSAVFVCYQCRAMVILVFLYQWAICEYHHVSAYRQFFSSPASLSSTDSECITCLRSYSPYLSLSYFESIRYILNYCIISMLSQ